VRMLPTTIHHHGSAARALEHGMGKS